MEDRVKINIKDKTRASMLNSTSVVSSMLFKEHLKDLLKPDPEPENRFPTNGLFLLSSINIF